MNKKILLISTGGTISSVESEKGLIPGISADELLKYVDFKDKSVEIKTQNLFSMDSSNIQPEEWKVIATEVHNALTIYDGVIVTHGTDTMAYTSSMLSFMLQNLNKPVILTGSQLSITETGTDAIINLKDAINFVLSEAKGVFVVFGGKVILGCRAVKIKTLSFDAFESINALCQPQEVENSWFKENPIKEIIYKSQNILDINIDVNVFLLKLVPGTNPAIFKSLIQLGYRGVVIEAFGLGGVHYLRRDLTKEIENLIREGIAVVITSQCLYECSNLQVYEVGRMLWDMNVICAYDMTSEAAITKLMWVLGQTADLNKVKQMMLTNYCGEINI